MRPILLFSALTFIIACNPVEKEPIAPNNEVSKYGDYPLETVDIRQVKMTDAFWLPWIKTVQEKTIEYALAKCAEEGRFDNFLLAGGEMQGEVKGLMPFDDTDVYKVIEGASNTLISSPNPELELLLDSLIAIIHTGQEEDGYLTTWRTINPAKPPATWVKVREGKRWSSLEASHELYNSGHLFEAAAVHHAATGKKNFLNIATKNADLLVNTFGPGKLEAVPGHQIVETGLIKLYRITGKEPYLELARFFLDARGDSTTHALYGPYNQDHLPVIKQDEVVGHAVRAVYMYAGMTDIAALYRDADYQEAIHHLWENMVYKKMYLTGGIGSRHEGEAFGENYELPNLTAYNETCAAIGDVYWNHRLFMLEGKVKYFDVIERTLYNGLISGLSLSGTAFFYPNPLESDGKYQFNQGACTRKSWFDCSCCPTNMIRFLPAVPGLIYARHADTLYINLYASNEAEIELESTTVKVTQQTDYPRKGKVMITIAPATSADFVVKTRIPGWVRNEVLPGGLYTYNSATMPSYTMTINGEAVEAEMTDGYVSFNRKWNQGDQIELNFELKVRQVSVQGEVLDDQSKIALEYGPLVYAIEEIDNPTDFDQIAISGNEKFVIEEKKDLLQGVNLIKGSNDQGTFTAIPYYAWSNRGIGKMKVWLPMKE